MNEGVSDFIIAVSIVIGGIVAKKLPRKVKWGWKVLIALFVAIALSMLGHLLVKVACR